MNERQYSWLSLIMNPKVLILLVSAVGYCSSNVHRKVFSVLEIFIPFSCVSFVPSRSLSCRLFSTYSISEDKDLKTKP
ncbi:MAG: hypothetical protein EXX96DRAFT_583062 [Benjaminiella poitrasii]|nr:MAG: hypothetical protein EXX96DRAFT_583062 [Benjaminiella poitrasii]